MHLISTLPPTTCNSQNAVRKSLEGLKLSHSSVGTGDQKSLSHLEIDRSEIVAPHDHADLAASERSVSNSRPSRPCRPKMGTRAYSASGVSRISRTSTNVNFIERQETHRQARLRPKTISVRMDTGKQSLSDKQRQQLQVTSQKTATSKNSCTDTFVKYNGQISEVTVDDLNMLTSQLTPNRNNLTLLPRNISQDCIKTRRPKYVQKSGKITSQKCCRSPSRKVSWSLRTANSAVKCSNLKSASTLTQQKTRGRVCTPPRPATWCIKRTPSLQRSSKSTITKFPARKVNKRIDFGTVTDFTIERTMCNTPSRKTARRSSLGSFAKKVVKRSEVFTPGKLSRRNSFSLSRGRFTPLVQNVYRPSPNSSSCDNSVELENISSELDKSTYFDSANLFQTYVKEGKMCTHC